MNGFEKRVKDILKQHGWWFLRAGKGSHEIWTNGNLIASISQECRSRHTANGIMRAAKIDHRF